MELGVSKLPLQVRDCCELPSESIQLLGDLPGQVHQARCFAKSVPWSSESDAFFLFSSLSSAMPRVARTANQNLIIGHLRILQDDAEQSWAFPSS